MRYGGQDRMECLGHHAFAAETLLSPAGFGPWCPKRWDGRHRGSSPSTGHVGSCSGKCQFITCHQIALKKHCFRLLFKNQLGNCPQMESPGGAEFLRGGPSSATYLTVWLDASPQPRWMTGATETSAWCSAARARSNLRASCSTLFVHLLLCAWVASLHFKLSWTWVPDLQHVRKTAV